MSRPVPPDAPDPVATGRPDVTPPPAVEPRADRGTYGQEDFSPAARRSRDHEISSSTLPSVNPDHPLKDAETGPVEEP